MSERLLNLELLEFHVVHHCNLTCAGCSHFSPTAPSWFATPEHFENEVGLAAERLLPTYVHLLGGEPLLHPTLHELIPIARNAFARSTIKLVSNGVLFPRASRELLTAMVEHDIHLAVSVYPKVKTNQKLIEAVCREHGITCEFWVQDTFLDFINPAGDTNPSEARAKCPMEGASTVRDGRLYPCPVTAWADFNGTAVCESDGVGLNESLPLLASVLDLSRTTSRCRFCHTSPERVPHRLTRARK